MVLATQNPIEHEGTYPLPEAQLDRFMLHVRVDPPPPDVERRILALARAEALAGLDGEGASVRGRVALTPRPLPQAGEGAGGRSASPLSASEEEAGRCRASPLCAPEEESGRRSASPLPLAGEGQGEGRPSATLLHRADLRAARREALSLYLAPELEDYIVRLVAATRTPEAVDPSWRGAVRFGASPRASIALDRGARARAWLAGRDHVSPADIQDLAGDVLRHRVLLGYEALADGRTADDLVDDLLRAVVVP
jgi:MoxR-like ATPase